MGWTLNFANRYSYLIIFLIIVIILVSLTSKFFLQSKNTGKIDPRVACESALAYTTFSSGEEADAFVKDCIDGKYPEVIERYIQDMGLNGKTL